ncbi:uncharacterized protein LOC103710566 isoform X3 [Phoenix dactylifera]|uniref:Uncharacterized protein LOC103710566 isoform X3 n=1 Tax=Phoenix dactylifera TaxID=42345 RepID=A0A8B8ZT32_PHODC|nr:uncharacterized protein LOC103710566 isoform X3 [Phoenix dactylifera]
MKSLKKSAVLYHYPCPDGAFAALAAHLYFSATSQPVLFFPNTVYDPIRVDTLPLEKLGNVYLLDFVGPSGFVAEISSKVESVTILDHHKTAFETLCGNASIGNNVAKVIDMKRSGATIAFDFFREKLLARSNNSENHAVGSNAVAGAKFLPDSKFERVGRLFRYIEDADLWRWALPYSKAFSSGLKDMDIEYNINVNSALFDQAVDADSISNLRSELGHQLAIKSHNLKLRGIGAVVYKVPEIGDDQMLKVSIRSVDAEDTTPISQEYGGGGHRNASSFMLRAVEFETWKVQTEPPIQAND